MFYQEFLLICASESVFAPIFMTTMRKKSKIFLKNSQLAKYT